MKLLTLGILGLFLFSFGLSFVSAGPDIVGGTKEFIGGAYELIEPLIGKVIGETDTGEFFLAKILFLLVIFAIVWKAIEKIPFFSDNEWVLWVVSISVSILSIRWFGNIEIIKTVILPYSALGIAVSAGIPFALGFLIIEGLNKTMRKFAWIFFAVVFLFLWFTRYEDLGRFGYIYLVTAGLSIGMMIFDGTIQKWRVKVHLDKVGLQTKQDSIDDYQRKIADLPNLVRNGILTNIQADKRKKGYQKQIAWLSK